MIKTVKLFLEDKYWIWAFLGSFALWLVIGIVTSKLNIGSLLSNGTSAAFLAIPALGQMYVVSCGRGAIDLSIPGVITLTAFLSTGIIDGLNANVFHGILICLAVGAAIGFANSISVLFLKIPPIIATLAMGYILTTATLIYNEGFAAFKISPFLLTISRGKIAGIPCIIILGVALGAVAAFVMHRTAYGRSLTAVGQNIEAAHLAGINTNRTQMLAYIISGLFSGLAGVLIAARVGGAFLGMGNTYLLETVGAVVIGGTLIFGGRSTIVGTLFGCLFLVLIVTAMQVAGFPVGTQNIVKGFLIILVLIVATKKESA
ncbi:MAG: ABC transporter permease [Spirochaetia bacterium]